LLFQNQNRRRIFLCYAPGCNNNEDDVADDHHYNDAVVELCGDLKLE